MRKRNALASGLIAGAALTCGATGALAQGPSTYLGSTGPSSSDSPYVVPTAPGVHFRSLLTVGDSPNLKDGPAFPGTPWRMVGIPDGLGAFPNGDGTYTTLMNHELPSNRGIVRDHGSPGAFVSRLRIDRRTGEVRNADDQIQDVFLNPADAGYVPATTAFNRLCSADLAPVSAFAHRERGRLYGTTERIFLNGEEAGTEGRAFGHQATDGDRVDGDESDNSYELPRLGKFSWENALASPGSGRRTVVANLDDSTPGEVYIYAGEKQRSGETSVERAGLTNGRLFGIAVDGVPVDTAATPEQTRFRLVEQGGPDGNAGNDTGAQLQAESTAEQVTKFARPEDGAWDPTDRNRFYFVTTGSATAPTRLWAADFEDVSRPELGGTLKILVEGGPDPVETLDNIDTNRRGEVLMQEDPGASPRLAKIWRYEPRRDERSRTRPEGDTGLTELAQHDPARFSGAPVPAPFGAFNTNEESSGIVDASDVIGKNWYLLDVQAHYQATDPEIVEGGQLLAMYAAPGRRVGQDDDHGRDDERDDRD